jgi:uncharacterized DUF497 family protein
VGNIEFAWDRQKARTNLAKHGVSFEEAQTVFLDENARLIGDPDHSEEEERFVPLGYDPADLRQVRHTAGRTGVLETPMRSEYDFSKSRKNPYASQLKRQVTIRLDVAAVSYFKEMAAELGMPYQNLINLFLRDCALEKRRPVIQWLQKASKGRVGR